MFDATPQVAIRGSAGSISPESADSLAGRLLGDLRTKLGGLQIAHARRVAASVRDTGDDRVVAVALLHDVVEKGRITPDELLGETGDRRLVELVNTLSRRDGELYADYLTRCAADPIALLVKRADLADKLVADDSNVEAELARRIRREASTRLKLLNLLARRGGE